MKRAILAAIAVAGVGCAAAIGPAKSDRMIWCKDHNQLCVQRRECTHSTQCKTKDRCCCLTRPECNCVEPREDGELVACCQE